MIERDAFSYLEMVRSLVRFLFRTVEQTLRKYGMVHLSIHLSFRQRQFDLVPILKWIKTCLIRKLEWIKKYLRYVRGIGEAYQTVSRSATIRCYRGLHIRCSLWQAQGRTQYVSVVFVQLQYGFGSLFSIRVSAHLVSHLESNRFDQFQEFYV